MIAARKSGRRSALTLRTALNSTAVPQAGQWTVIVWNIDMIHFLLRSLIFCPYNVSSQETLGFESFNFPVWNAAYSSENHSPGARNWYPVIPFLRAARS